MKSILIRADSAQLELTLGDLGLLMNALEQDLGIQQSRTVWNDPELPEGYTRVLADLRDVFHEMVLLEDEGD